MSVFVCDGEFILTSQPRFVLGKGSPVGEVIENCIVRFNVVGVDVEVGVEVAVLAEGSGPLSLASSAAADKDKALAALSRWNFLCESEIKKKVLITISHMPEQLPPVTGGGGGACAPQAMPRILTSVN